MATEKRLIDANALKEKAFAETESGEGIVYVQDIDEAPTVDAVEVVHGRWKMGFSVRCSVCNGYALTDEDNDPWITPYCPNCGAKMDGGAEHAC